MTLSQTLDPTLCRCPCHKPGIIVRHMFPCCYICEYCNRRIATDIYREHIAACKERLDLAKFLKRFKPYFMESMRAVCEVLSDDPEKVEQAMADVDRDYEQKLSELESE